MMQLAPLFVPVPGGPELLIIAGIAVLLFGANKIPELARSTGQAAGEFKKGRQELESELEDVEDDLDPNTTSSTVDTDPNTTSEEVNHRG